MDTIGERTRITTRLSPEAHQRLMAAASLRGTTINAFVVQAALKEAEDVIEKDRVIKLTEASAKKIIELIDHPPEPNKHLKNAVEAYRNQVRDEA